MDNNSEQVNLAKSLDEDKRLFTAVVLRPEVVDAHGDIYSHEVVEKACHDYNINCQAANLQHIFNTDLVTPVESYISKATHTLGEGEVVEGDWVLTFKVESEEIWEMCKGGTFTGMSVGCSARVVELEDDSNES